MDESRDQAGVRRLYQELLDAWNNRSAAAMAAVFAEDGSLVAFDGSSMAGPAEIEASVGEIFTHHQTPPYVSKVKSVRLLTPDVAVLSAIVGMAPPGERDLDPALNAIQTLVAAKRDGNWRIALF
jgi:uncharacterized protein (TIGR02246 family)